MKLGSADISKIYLGGTEVTKAYLGSTLVHNTSPTPSDPYPVLDLFQANVLQLGKCFTYSSGRLSQSNNSKRIAANKTTINLPFTYVKFKMKDGFNIAMAAYKGSSYASSNADGTFSVQSSWSWIVPNTIVTLALATYDTFAFNVRYADNTTVFTNNTLSNYIDYIVATNQP